jgi:hypothetical protein
VRFEPGAGSTTDDLYKTTCKWKKKRRKQLEKDVRGNREGKGRAGFWLKE